MICVMCICYWSKLDIHGTERGRYKRDNAINPKVVRPFMYLSLRTKTLDCPYGTCHTNSPTGIRTYVDIYIYTHTWDVM